MSDQLPMSPRVQVRRDGLVLVDGIPAFKAQRDEADDVVITLQDKANCHRTQERGTRDVQVPLDYLVERVREDVP